MRLIAQRHHPKKAVKKEKKGAFSIYHFQDGATLTIRRTKEEKVLSDKWVPGRDLKSRTLVDEFQLGDSTVIVRRGKIAPANRLTDFYRRLYRGKVRFEPPVAWLVRPNKRSVIITRAVQGYHNLRWMRRHIRRQGLGLLVISNLALELGKMHGTGIQHGHPHDKNVLVNHQGKVTLIDPKFMASTKKPPLQMWRKYAPLRARRIKREFFQGRKPRKGIVEDLSWLLHISEGFPEANKNDVIKAYKKGFALARTRRKK